MIPRTIFLLAITISAVNAGHLKPKGDPCPEGNGFYGVGCSKYYIQCVYNTEFERQCPEGLYFDRYFTRCERRSDVTACNEDAKNFVNIRQKAFTPDCEGRRGGDYPIEKTSCEGHYYTCANGEGFMRQCPYDQFFNAKAKKCDYLDNCLRSAKISGHINMPLVYANTTNHAESSTVKSEEIHPVENLINCTALGNATISLKKCSPDFWMCANGKLFKKACPNGLVYDADRNLCDFSQETPGCLEFNGTAAVHISSLQQTFDCSTKSDGFYPLGDCESTFFSCNGGVKREIPCADHLVFDVRIAACDYPEACKSERKHVEIPQLFNHGRISDTKQEKDAPIVFDCSTKQDGLYVKEPCTKNYIQCNDKVSFALTCPANLVFNLANHACDYVENCDKNFVDVPRTNALSPLQSLASRNSTTTAPAITASITTTTTSDDYNAVVITSSPYETTTEKVSTTTITAEPTTTTTAAPATTTTAPLIDFSCAQLVDGLYASGPCKKKFHQCWNEQLYSSHCPANLVFNPYKGQCDYESNVPDCYGGAPPAPQPPTTTSAPVIGESETQAPEPRPSPAPAVIRAIDPFCERLADGNYGFGCSPYFYQCANFETSKIRCTGNLYFHAEKQMCDYKVNIPDCNRDTEIREEQPAIIIDPYTSTSKSPSTPAGPPPVVPYYTTSSSSAITPEDSSPTPASNTEQATTVYSTPATPSVTAYTASPETTIITQNEEKQQHKFSCVGRVDGIYAFPYCTPDYAQCVNGRTLVLSCAHGLQYSETTGLCDYKKNVPVCSKKTPVTEDIPEESCSGKDDGYYSFGCSSVYYSCIGETIRKMTCPANLKFSSSKAVCDYPNDVTECTSTSTPAQTPPKVDSSFCENKTEGLHEFHRCSPNYVVCDNGVPTAGTCAAPLVFNGTTKMCDYKSNNQNCSTVSTTHSPY